MYLNSQNYTEANTVCTSVPGFAQESNLPKSPDLRDCLEAALQLQAKGDNPCVVPHSTPSNASADTYGTLAKAGSCQIILGGAILGQDGNSVGNALPCSRVADYARNIDTVCSNSQMITGGIFNPNKSSSSTIYVQLSGN